MATLVEVVQEVCRRLAQPVPSTVYGSTDKQVGQMMALLREGLDALTTRAQWQRLNFEYTWTTIANENQGVLLAGLGSPVTAYPAGFSYLLPETLWDRTNVLPLVGPLDAQDWQAMKAWIIKGPRYQFRIRQGNFYINPAPTAGWTWAFEYMSDCWGRITGGGAYIKAFTADTNEILLPEQFVMLDLRWRWKKEKGLPYAEDFNSLEAMLADFNARNKPRKRLDMGCSDSIGYPVKPVIVVPGGSWNV